MRDAFGVDESTADATLAHRLLFHDGDWRAADVCGESDRVRVPLHALKPLGPDRTPRAGATPQLAISPSSVRLSAFHEASDGYVLRLYESAGAATEARVALPARFLQAIRTDFNLEALDAPVKLDGETLTVPLRPWEIATVLLER